LQNSRLEAASRYFEEEHEKISGENLKSEIDFQQFFKYYKVLNAKFLAQKIGMNPTLLSQYVNGKKNPTEIQAKKFLIGIHQLGQELSEVNLIYLGMNPLEDGCCPY
jgi:transcriptional regulator with XRE-family HTH domain